MDQKEEECQNKSPTKRMWGGIGSFLSSVKDKTLKLVDDLQDRITEFDESMEKIAQKPKKEFDPNLLPILENAATYLDEPTNESYHSFYETFDLQTKQEDISLFQENCPNLRRIYSRLVPSAFSEKDFWARLFFKLELREESQKSNEEPKENNNKQTIDENFGLSNEELAELEAMELDDEEWDDLE